MTLDMSRVIVAKSDQLNADDLIGGSITVQVTGVKISETGEQQVAISYTGDNGKPWKPCKSMCRILVHCWGVDAKQYAGRWLTLYRDDEVTWGGMKVGGIRISHASHISGQQVVAIAEKKGKKKPHIVKVLEVPSQAPKQVETEIDIAALCVAGEDAAIKGLDSLRTWWGNIGRQSRDALGGQQYIDGLKLIAETIVTNEVQND